jgi:hypothetical protein
MGKNHTHYQEDRVIGIEIAGTDTRHLPACQGQADTNENNRKDKEINPDLGSPYLEAGHFFVVCLVSHV